MDNPNLYSSAKAKIQFEKFRNQKANHWNKRINAITKRANNISSLGVIDLGCGIGTFAIIAMQKGACWSVGVDSSYEMISEGLNLSKEYKVCPSLLCADVLNNPFPKEYAQLVISADLIEHLDPDHTLKFLLECKRLLVPGGRLILHT